MSRLIRLAIVGSRGVPARYGGFETFAEEIGKRLVERGVEVTVFCEKGGGELPSSHQGMRLLYAPSPNLGPLETLVYDFASLWRTRRNYDVVYMLGYTSAILCVVSRLWKNEVWINMDGLEWKRGKWPWYGRLFLRLMEISATLTGKMLIADSHAIRADLEKRYERLPPCRVIRYGCELPELTSADQVELPAGLDAGGYHLIVARLEPENHIEEMILGYRQSGLPEPLAIVGNHLTGTRYTKKLIRHAGPDVRFLGAIYDKESLVQVRRHAKTYLHGHSVGGTNPSLLESMACASPVIAHENPFNREVAGECGLFFVDAADLAENLRLLAQDKELGRSLGARARDRVAECYQWQEIADQYSSLLAERVGELARIRHPKSAAKPVKPRICCVVRPIHSSAYRRVRIRRELADRLASPGLYGLSRRIGVSDAS